MDPIGVMLIKTIGILIRFLILSIVVIIVIIGINSLLAKIFSNAYHDVSVGVGAIALLWLLTLGYFVWLIEGKGYVYMANNDFLTILSLFLGFFFIMLTLMLVIGASTYR